jgi:hypothetical protein
MRPCFGQTQLLRICLMAMVLLSPALVTRAQGCSMCRDTTAGSAPQVRAGLRRAIPVLAIPAIALFIGFLVVAHRTDAWHRREKTQTIDDDR